MDALADDQLLLPDGSEVLCRCFMYPDVCLFCDESQCCLGLSPDGTCQSCNERLQRTVRLALRDDLYGGFSRGSKKRAGGPKVPTAAKHRTLIVVDSALIT